MPVALDFDLSSIQEARDLVRKAKKAQEAFCEYTEQAIEQIVAAMAAKAAANAERLARAAVEETDYGVVEHKVMKNLFAARDVFDYIKTTKTTGIIGEDAKRKVVEVAVPMGVILALTPTTNPTSTVIHNALIAVKAGNAIIFSPHPNAAKCSAMAARLLQEAAAEAGAPEGLISCLTQLTMKATEELMRHADVSVIIATGGSAMVRAAYSAGKPAFGVGPGNVPAFIERSADVRQAVEDIVTSKTFDNGMICASEQVIIADEPIEDAVRAELKRLHCHFLNEDEVHRLGATVMTPRGGMNAALVGKTARYIADKAGICVPEETRLLIAPLKGYGPDHPLSYEKLTSVLGFYTVKDWHEACLLSIELLKLGGIGHSFAIHSTDARIIREFIRKPVFRILVNTPSALGGIGYSTGLTPSMTLGCGTWGGSSISENLGPRHLVNIKRLAYGTRKVELEKMSGEPAIGTFSSEDIAGVVRQVLRQMQLQ